MLTLLSLLVLHSSGVPTLAYLSPEEMFLQDQSQYYGAPAGVGLPINPRRAEWNAEADASARAAAASAQAAADRAAVAPVSSSSSVASDDHSHRPGGQADFWGPSMDWGNTNLDPETVRMLKRLEYQSHLQAISLPEPPPSNGQPLASSGPGQIVALSATILAICVTAYVAWKKKVRGISF